MAGRLASRQKSHASPLLAHKTCGGEPKHSRSLAVSPFSAGVLDGGFEVVKIKFDFSKFLVSEKGDKVVCKALLSHGVFCKISEKTREFGKGEFVA